MVNLFMVWHAECYKDIHRFIMISLYANEYRCGTSYYIIETVKTCITRILIVSRVLCCTISICHLFWLCYCQRVECLLTQMSGIPSLSYCMCMCVCSPYQAAFLQGHPLSRAIHNYYSKAKDRRLKKETND